VQCASPRSDCTEPPPPRNRTTKNYSQYNSRIPLNHPELSWYNRGRLPLLAKAYTPPHSLSISSILAPWLDSDFPLWSLRKNWNFLKIPSVCNRLSYANIPAYLICQKNLINHLDDADNGRHVSHRISSAGELKSCHSSQSSLDKF
jgi:hypothetical protein